MNRCLFDGGFPFLPTDFGSSVGKRSLFYRWVPCILPTNKKQGKADRGGVGVRERCSPRNIFVFVANPKLIVWKKFKSVGAFEIASTVLKAEGAGKVVFCPLEDCSQSIKERNLRFGLWIGEKWRFPCLRYDQIAHLQEFPGPNSHQRVSKFQSKRDLQKSPWT